MDGSTASRRDMLCVWMAMLYVVVNYGQEHTDDLESHG